MIAGRQTMLRYAAGIVIFISCSALLLWAQQAADVAYFEQVRIKPGEVEKYETTLKRHWTWHEKQGETWSYFVWSVDTGKNEGAYQVASFAHSWKEVDESNALVAGTPGPEEDPEPYVAPISSEIKRGGASFSNALEASVRMAFLFAQRGWRTFEVEILRASSSDVLRMTGVC
jgi:hypothetical protein